MISGDFAGIFRVIAFPIYEDHNSVSAVNPRGNGKPFAEAFGVPLLSFDEFVTSAAELRDSGATVPTPRE